MREPLEVQNARAIARMAAGSHGGMVQSAAPVAPIRFQNERNGSGFGDAPDVIFDQAGAVALSPTNVGRKRFRRAVSGIYVVATLDVAGTSDTVVTLYKNGASIGTVTLGSGVTDVTASITSAFDGVDDYLQAKVTTVGTGSPAELVVEVWGV